MMHEHLGSICKQLYGGGRSVDLEIQYLIRHMQNTNANI